MIVRSGAISLHHERRSERCERCHLRRSREDSSRLSDYTVRYLRWATLTLEVVAMTTDGPLSLRLPTDGGGELRAYAWRSPYSITDYI